LLLIYLLFSVSPVDLLLLPPALSHVWFAFDFLKKPLCPLCPLW